MGAMVGRDSKWLLVLGCWLGSTHHERFFLCLDATLNIAYLVSNVGVLFFTCLENCNVENGNLLQQKPGLLQL